MVQLLRVPAPPERIELTGAYLRMVGVDDAPAVAAAVRANLEHLKPWMAWADETACDAAFQRERLRGAVERWHTREEHQYGLFVPGDDTTFRGSFGLMTRRGRGTLEIGYWLAADVTGQGHATRAAAALTDVALRVRGVRRSLVYTDEANVRSAAIPQRLGYELLKIEVNAPTAPGESGRTQVWVRTKPIDQDLGRSVAQ
ncbi:MAG TPA: GNAT family N-acetyltransferase [Acidimicrobiia bacterium]|nr:GNAT family N-acetyltransferase [Acidimicrobiia bacterium]